MLKWAKTSNPSRHETTKDENSNDSDSSEYGLGLHGHTDTVPIRYHERVSRPKSLALSVVDIEIPELMSEPKRRATQPDLAAVVKSPPYSGATEPSRFKRHSMFASSPMKLSVSDASNSVDDILSLRDFDGESDLGILKITTDSKPKSRNAFWKSLKAKAQGIRDKRLSKAQSMSNLPDSQISISPEISDIDKEHPRMPIVSPADRPELNIVTTPSRPSRTGVQRRRSFKLIKKQSQDKRPKPFTKTTANRPYSDIDGETTSSPDSGISSIRQRADSDCDARSSTPSSPVTPIDVDGSMDLSSLTKQFTDAVLQYLKEKNEDPCCGSSRSSSINSDDSGSSDIFCYDNATIIRKQPPAATRTAS